jgi:hypothetical protein
MLLRSARVTLKQHRFEFGAAVTAAFLVGVWALWVNSKLAALDIPGKCFPIWQGSVAEMTPACSQAVQAFQQINGGTDYLVFLALGVLPFAVGLVGGVPIVGRELEARTAQTAWALAASRRRWIGRQLWPVVTVLGLAIAFAATAGSLLEGTRSAYFPTILGDIGLHGPSLVARAMAAFGLGLAAGAGIGRTLPAFIVGAAVAIGLLVVQSTAKEAWVAAQPRVLLEGVQVGNPLFAGMWASEAWRAPDGRLLSDQDAFALVPAEGMADDPYEWLAGQGYERLAFGLTAETLREWEPMEIAGTVFVGLVLVLASVAVVDAKRPT